MFPVYDAAVALCVEAGYHGMTLEAVAARAGVSKPTIYRRSPEGKAQLVTAAIASHREGKPRVPDTATLRAGSAPYLFPDVGPSPIYGRVTFQSGHPLDDAFATELVDRVLLPIPNPRTSEDPSLTATTYAPERAALDRGLLTVAAVVVLGAVMSIPDTTVVNVAINTLAQDFSTTLPTIQWVVTGYTLALATVIPLTCRSRSPAKVLVPGIAGVVLLALFVRHALAPTSR